MIFISGWAGFKTLYPELSKKYTYLTPFLLEDNLQQIEQELISSKAKILIGWSTGAHIILKNLENIKDNFEKIYLIAPFLYFLVDKKLKVLEIMIEAFKKDPTKVIKNFLNKAGVKNIKIEDYNEDSLLKGLAFLKNSKINSFNPDILDDKVIIIYGEKDKIVKIDDIFKKLKNYIELKNYGHYIPEEILSEIIYETSNKKIF